MQSKMDTIQQLPTSLLKEKFYEEWERVSGVILKHVPVSDGNLKWLLEELLLMHEELERRKVSLNS